MSSGSELQPEDLADVAGALAALQYPCQPVGRLVDAVAHEVYRQISNRYSMTAPFRPPDIVKLLSAYTQLVDPSSCDGELSGPVMSQILTMHTGMVQPLPRVCDGVYNISLSQALCLCVSQLQFLACWMPWRGM